VCWSKFLTCCIHACMRVGRLCPLMHNDSMRLLSVTSSVLFFDREQAPAAPTASCRLAMLVASSTTTSGTTATTAPVRIFECFPYVCPEPVLAK
jgi:hypothetical protein